MSAGAGTVTPTRACIAIATCACYGAIAAFWTPWWSLAWALVWVLIAAFVAVYEMGRRAQ